MQNNINVLVVGDIVGRGARNAFINNIDRYVAKYGIDLLIVNGENTTNGNGLNYKHYLSLINAGVDVITMGNHTFGNKEIYEYIGKAKNIVVPGNLNDLPESFKNNVSYTYNFNGKNIKIVNILGTFNMKCDAMHPFLYFDKVYEEDHDSIYIVDYHAELTAEKLVFGYELDGKASIMFGTHTHVQTADDRILPQGMAYISDVGMVGAKDSVIGFNYKEAVKSQRDNSGYEIERKGPFVLNAMAVTIDLDSKKAIAVERINDTIE